MCMSRARIPAGRTRPATFTQPTDGSIQWKAVAENAASKVDAGSATSSKRPRWKLTASPARRRASAIMFAPGSTASTTSPRSTSASVSFRCRTRSRGRVSLRRDRRSHRPRRRARRGSPAAPGHMPRQRRRRPPRAARRDCAPARADSNRHPRVLGSLEARTRLPRGATRQPRRASCVPSVLLPRYRNHETSPVSRSGVRIRRSCRGGGSDPSALRLSRVMGREVASEPDPLDGQPADRMSWRQPGLHACRRHRLQAYPLLLVGGQLQVHDRPVDRASQGRSRRVVAATTNRVAASRSPPRLRRFIAPAGRCARSPLRCR